MHFYIGNTDFNWYQHLSSRNPEDVNFWRPGGKTSFNALTPGAPFLFKLKAPYNAIAGVGFFSSFTVLPLSLAWEVFQERNGCDDIDTFRKKISSYRTDWWDINPSIGCIVLTDPIFFKREDWILTPENWSPNIVQGKKYDTNDEIGKAVWDKVEILLRVYLRDHVDASKSQLLLEKIESPTYRTSVLTKVRLGQGAFRVLITDAYTRKCSISGEKTLPVLDAAHIKPYSKSGPHFISNGLLLRSDLHKLFDLGYLTVTNSFRVEISKKIKEEFENGRDYYKYHGAHLSYLPVRDMDKPSSQFLDWHNQTTFKS